MRAKFDFIQVLKNAFIQDKSTINKGKPTWKECVQNSLQVSFRLHIIHSRPAYYNSKRTEDKAIGVSQKPRTGA